MKDSTIYKMHPTQTLIEARISFYFIFFLKKKLNKAI